MSPGGRRSAFINGFGAVVTGIVLVIVAVTKTLEGAWIVLLLIPIIVAVFKATHRHYDHVGAAADAEGLRAADPPSQHRPRPHRRLARAVVEALRYAETLSDDVRAIYVDVNAAQTEQLRRDWDEWGGSVALIVLPSPFRSLMEPLLEYIEQAAAEKANDYVTVILPEFVPARWWQHLLHNQTCAADQRCAAVPDEYCRHQRAVPPVEVAAGSFPAAWAVSRSSRDRSGQAHHLPDVGFIVDDQQSHQTSFPLATGTVNVKVEPRPGSDCTVSRPPCPSTIRREMVSPRPTPPADALGTRTNGSKMVGR